MSVVRVTLFQTFWNQSVQNVLHFDDGVLTYDAATIKDDVVANWITHVKILQNAFLTYIALSVKNLDDPTGPTTTFPLSIGGGSFATGYVLGMPALIIKIQTALGTRAGRGRSYICGLPGAGYDQGHFDSGTQTSINAVVANLVDAYVSTSTTSPMTIGVRGRASGAAFHPAIGLIGRPVPGIQRRRNLNVGI
jgi:hypothetical protein